MPLIDEFIYFHNSVQKISKNGAGSELIGIPIIYCNILFPSLKYQFCRRYFTVSFKVFLVKTKSSNLFPLPV